MAEKTIEQRVKDIIVEQLGVNADQVTPDHRALDQLLGDGAASQNADDPAHADWSPIEKNLERPRLS